MHDEYEARFELLLANLLRAGVLLSAAVVLLGAILYLIKFGGDLSSDHAVFKMEPPELRTFEGVAEGALQLDGRAVIEIGLLLLVATPVVRVAFSVYGFLRERDFVYVGMTFFVLAVLLFSLFFGGAH